MQCFRSSESIQAFDQDACSWSLEILLSQVRQGFSAHIELFVVRFVLGHLGQFLSEHLVHEEGYGRTFVL